MSQHILKKSAMDAAAWEAEIGLRLRRGKTRLLISDLAAFIAAMIVVFFVI